MKETKFKVNMHCASCAINIDKKLKKMGCKSQSNPALKIIKVKHNNNVSSHDIVQAIKEVGYEATEW